MPGCFVELITPSLWIGICKFSGGAGGIRTLVQTRNQYVFYMLSLLFIVGCRPVTDNLPAT